MTNTPQIRPVNAQELRTALQGGREGLKLLIMGNDAQNLTRNQRLNRTRRVIELLPTLQLTVEQRQLVTTVTHQILVQFQSDIELESQSQVGERLLKLQAEQKEIADARAAVLAQENQNQQPNNAPATSGNATQTPPSGFIDTVGREFQNSSPGRQWLIAGTIAATAAAAVWLWTKMSTWMKVATVGIGAWIGLPHILRYVRTRRNVPTARPTTPARPAVVPPASHPPAPATANAPTNQAPAVQPSVNAGAVAAQLPESVQKAAKNTQESTEAFRTNPASPTLLLLTRHIAGELRTIERENIGAAAAFQNLALPRILELLRVEEQSINSAVTVGVFDASPNSFWTRECGAFHTLYLQRTARFREAFQNPTEQSIRAAITANTSFRNLYGRIGVSEDTPRIHEILRGVGDSGHYMEYLLRHDFSLRNGRPFPAN